MKRETLLGAAAAVAALLYVATRKETVMQTPDFETPAADLTDEQIRARIVQVALDEVGTEAKDPFYYYADVAPPGQTEAAAAKYAATRHWCGFFALWVLRKAGLARAVSWKDGLGFCYLLKQVTPSAAKPGDIAYVHKPYQHHAVVVSVDPLARTIDTVDGNQEGDTVALRTRSLSEVQVYSIDRFLSAERSA